MILWGEPHEEIFVGVHQTVFSQQKWVAGRKKLLGHALESEQDLGCSQVRPVANS